MHNLSVTATLFLYLIIFCFGAAIGALIERALKRRFVPPSSLSASVNELANEGDVKVLSAWRSHDAKVWLEMDGTRLENKVALQPGQYQRLVKLVLDLRPWLESARPANSGSGTTPQPARPAASPAVDAAQSVSPAVPPAAEATQSVSLMAPTVMDTPQPVSPLAQVPQAPAIQMQPEKKKGSSATEGVKPAPVLDSIIQQIDHVLQAKLATSEFKDRDIQLVEGPGGIVIVKDGKNKYEGVDGIPDPQVKALIQQAVSDWEKGIK